MISGIDFAIVALLAEGVLAFGVAIHVAKALGRAANFRTMILMMYLLVNIASGVVHLARLSGFNTGYYDMLKGNNSNISIAVVSSFIGLAGLSVGCLRSLRRDPPSSMSNIAMTRGARLVLVCSAIVLFAVSILALRVMNAYVVSSGSNRIISLDQGMARTSFLAEWFTWAVSFLAIWLATTRWGKSQLRLAILLSGAAAAIVWSLGWTEGRSIGVMMCLPLILTFWSRLGRLKMPLATVFVVSAVINIATLTGTRTANNRLTDYGPASAIDWQLGRFSMMGFAQDYVERHGFLLGETFASAAMSVPMGVLKILGIARDVILPQSITQISGQELLGSSALINIVPGLSAELYMNFGLIGIGVGYFALGRAVSFVDSRYARTHDPLKRFSWAYVGVLLIFNTVSSQSGAFPNYAFFVGLPVMVMLIWSSRRPEPQDAHSVNVDVTQRTSNAETILSGRKS